MFVSMFYHIEMVVLMYNMVLCKKKDFKLLSLPDNYKIGLCYQVKTHCLTSIIQCDGPCIKDRVYTAVFPN